MRTCQFEIRTMLPLVLQKDDSIVKKTDMNFEWIDISYRFHRLER